jgi:hypothetical protein
LRFRKPDTKDAAIALLMLKFLGETVLMDLATVRETINSPV